MQAPAHLEKNAWKSEDLHEANRLIRLYHGEETIAKLKRAYIIFCVHQNNGWKAHGHRSITQWANELGMSRRQCFNLVALGRVATVVLEAISEKGVEGVDVSKLILLQKSIEDNIHDKDKIQELVDMTKTHGYRDIKDMMHPKPPEIDFRAVLTKITRPGKTQEWSHCVYPINVSPENIWMTFGNKECRIHVYLLENDDG